MSRMPSSPERTPRPDLASDAGVRVAQRTERVLRLVAAWGFPIGIWLVATFYLGGALGKNTDDYAINFRDPVTNAIPAEFNPFRNYPFFWRPLHVFMCFTVGTFFPDWDRTVHFFCAAFHGLACVGLFCLLRRTLRTMLAPAAAALLFMVLPLNGEVPFWFCTTSTAIGVACTFAALLLVVRFARARTEVGEHRWGLVVPIAAIAFVVPCWYEQSAAPLAAIPAVYLACCPSSQKWLTRLFRAAVATGVGGGMCVLYVALMLATAPTHARGGAGSIVTAGRLSGRLSEFAQSLRYNLGERAEQVLMGSITQGLQTVVRPASVVWACVLLTLAVLWLVWLARWDRHGQSIAGGSVVGDVTRSPEPTQSGVWRVRLWMLAAGAIVFLAGWLPVLIIDRQIIELRNLYAPLLGVAIVIAVGLDVVVDAANALRPRASIALRTTLAAMLLPLVGFGTIGMIGFQRHLQARYQQDQSEIRQLVTMIPDPPAGAIFAPFRTTHVTHTGYPIFDRSRFGVFETGWSGTPEIRRAYRRADIAATVFSPWAPLPLVEPDAVGIRYTLGLPSIATPTNANHAGKGSDAAGDRIRWESIIPFVVDADGRVKLIRRFDVERADHRDLEIRPATVGRALAERAEAIRRARERGEPGLANIPTTTRRYADEAAPPELIPLGGWAYLDGAQNAQGDAQFARVNCWGIFREATWLAAGTGRTAMRTVLAPSDRPEHVLLRATIGEYDLDKIPDAPAVEIVVTARNLPADASARGGDVVLGVLKLDPRVLRRSRRWLPLVATVPPRGPEGAELRVSVRRAESEPPDPQGSTRVLPPVWVTHGYQQSIEEASESSSK